MENDGKKSHEKTKGKKSNAIMVKLTNFLPGILDHDNSTK